jgi:hypothetical protein
MRSRRRPGLPVKVAGRWKPKLRAAFFRITRANCHTNRGSTTGGRWSVGLILVRADSAWDFAKGTPAHGLAMLPPVPKTERHRSTWSVRVPFRRTVYAIPTQDSLPSGGSCVPGGDSSPLESIETPHVGFGPSSPLPGVTWSTECNRSIRRRVLAQPQRQPSECRANQPGTLRTSPRFRCSRFSTTAWLCNHNPTLVAQPEGPSTARCGELACYACRERRG